MAEVQYATNGKGNLGVTLGAIGTGLGALAGAGGLAGLLGLRPGGGDPGEKPVTRYEMELIQKNNDKDNEIVLLKAQMYANERADGLQMQISQQAVWNATQQGVIGCIQGQIAQLQSMTQLMIPNANISPGWGPATVYPTPDVAKTVSSQAS